MSGLQLPSLWVLVSLLLLGGCATRPINPPITQTDPSAGYRFETRQARDRNKENLVILAFSGGGTRAATFSYGVLEFLRRTEVVGPQGNKVRLLDAVDVITGVSGGSFTALAYGLYGDKLFDDYEERFLKRDVQGEIVARTLSPANWGKLGTTGWGRSELAAELYDEILFNGATFGDLDRGQGPLILASATDISTGSRFVFSQRIFDVVCSDLNAVPLSRCPAPRPPPRRCPWCSPRSPSTTMVVPARRTPPPGSSHSSTPTTRFGPPRAPFAPSRPSKASATASIGPSRIWLTAAYRITSACAPCSIPWKSWRRCTTPVCHRRSTTRAASS
jgi:hypothetical protein